MHGSKPMASVRKMRAPGRGRVSQIISADLAAGPPPSADPACPHIRGAYAFHMRKCQKPESWDEDGKPEILTSTECVRAIATVKEQLQDRVKQGLPVPTDTIRIKAAIRIQAYFRGIVARKWSVKELAHDARRLDRLETLSRNPNHPTVQKMVIAPGYGPEDKKRKMAYRIVYAARKPLVEYGAAVRIQKWWRGWSTRRNLRDEIARVAHANATRVQAHFRRYRVAFRMARHINNPKEALKEALEHCHSKIEGNPKAEKRPNLPKSFPNDPNGSQPPSKDNQKTSDDSGALHPCVSSYYMRS